MPVMSRIERAFCASPPWGAFAEHGILPWALQGLDPQGSLLELGAGSGAMAAATARRYPELRQTVTDIDPAMVTAAERRLGHYANVTVGQADVTDLPFPDESVDVVASYLMLHHVVAWSQALTEVARILRPGGNFVGYDLTDSRLARWAHIADRSPYRLIPRDAWDPALRSGGFDRITLRFAFGQRMVRFTACKPD